jgi:hypothetical protein
MFRDCRLPAIVLVLLVGVACRTGTTTSPDVSAARDQEACRNLASIARWKIETTSASTSGTAAATAVQDVSCTFDRANIATRCEILIPSGACSTTSVVMTSWRSVDDFVDESRSIGRTLQIGSTSDNITTCAGGSAGPPVRGITRYFYDERRRVTRYEGLGANNTSTTVTYDDWDRAGRPTSGRLESSTGSPALALRLSYDDSTRTMVWEGTAAGQEPATTTTMFDANGNVVSTRMQAGAVRSTSTVDTSLTIPICK